MHVYVCIIKVSNNCKNTCHFAFLPLNRSCALFPHDLQATSGPAQNIIMSFTVLTSHHPLRRKATAQIWQLVKVSKYRCYINVRSNIGN